MEYKIYKSSMPYEAKGGLTAYSDESVLKPRRFYHTGLEHSLENILSKEEPEKEKDALEKMFSDKSRTLKATVKALFNEVMLRENLDSLLLYQINEDICRQHNYLGQVRDLMRFNYSTTFLDYFSKAKMKLEDNVLELEKEKRNEYHECWKDLMELKKELLSALKDYWDSNRKTGFLDHYHLDEIVENENGKGY